MRLKINEGKTKYMIMSRCPKIQQNRTIDDITFEQVNNFKYFWVNLNSKNGMYPVIISGW